jgi:hypothetical protein
MGIFSYNSKSYVNVWDLLDTYIKVNVLKINKFDIKY